CQWGRHERDHAANRQNQDLRLALAGTLPSVPYVDGPDWQAFFLDVLNGLAACGHMSGLFARKPCPLALMKSDCEGPYQCCGLYARGTEQGVLRRRCRPVVHHVEVSPSP